MPNQKGRDHVNSYTLESFEALCFNNTPAGSSYRAAVRQHTADLAAAYMADHPGELSQGVITVVGVPRGGIATAESLKEAFALKAAHPGQVVLAESRIKEASGSLFPAGTFERSSALIIADGIIATGKTIVDHLQQVPEAWNGIVKVFGNAAARMGIDVINQQAERMTQNVESAYGRIFEPGECKWVDFPGKKVYFVGMDAGIPDFGDHIAPTTPPPAFK